MKTFQYIVLYVILVSLFGNVFAAKIECPPADMVKRQVLVKNARTDNYQWAHPWTVKSDDFLYQGRQFSVEVTFLDDNLIDNIVGTGNATPRDKRIAKLQDFFSKKAELKQEPRVHWSDLAYDNPYHLLPDYCLCTYSEDHGYEVDAKTHSNSGDNSSVCEN